MPDALERACGEADTRVARSGRDEILQLGKSRDAHERLLALVLARRRIKLGESPTAYFELARNLIRDPDNNCRWQAVVVVGESLDTKPEAVWEVVKEFGDDPDEDVRAAIATCLLEHLLERDFDRYFPRIRQEILNGRSLMIDTLGSSWFGDKDDPNFKKVQAFVRNAQRGRSKEG